MTFRCTQKCLFSVPGPEGPLAFVGEADKEYESDIDYAERSRYMQRIDGPAEVVVPKNEFSGVIAAETYEKTPLYRLRTLAAERGVEGVEKMNTQTLSSRLRELDGKSN